LGCERAHLILGFISNRGNYCDTSHIQECHCAVFRSERGSLNRKKKKNKKKKFIKSFKQSKRGSEEFNLPLACMSLYSPCLVAEKMGEGKIESCGFEDTPEIDNSIQNHPLSTSNGNRDRGREAARLGTARESSQECKRRRKSEN
jgi:hypothetical protein